MEGVRLEPIRTTGHHARQTRKVASPGRMSHPVKKAPKEGKVEKQGDSGRRTSSRLPALASSASKGKRSKSRSDWHKRETAKLGDTTRRDRQSKNKIRGEP